MKLSRIIMWITLFSICLLAGLSTVESFFGAENAKLFFNTSPMIVYWVGMILLLGAGMVIFPRLLRKPGLLLMHVGCLLVIAGSMWSSEKGHRAAKALFGIDKIPTGYMVINEGNSESHVTAEDPKQHLGELPFNIRLNKFRIEYYKTDNDAGSSLFIKTPEGSTLQLSAKVGNTISLGQNKGRLTIVRTFRNFKMQMENGGKKALDVEGGSNPAVEVKIETPDGNSYSSYAFELFSHPQRDGFEMAYVSEKKPQMVRSYLSDLTVLDNGKETTHKIIAVNNPLYYGGYHFYQHSYGEEPSPYTVLSVTSDSGLYGVFGGYLMLCLGALWHFWLGSTTKRMDKAGNPE